MNLKKKHLFKSLSTIIDPWLQSTRKNIEESKLENKRNQAENRVEEECQKFYNFVSEKIFLPLFTMYFGNKTYI